VQSLLDQYAVQASYPVHWGDMDAARHVNNLVYMRWGESARLSYFEQMGMDVSFSLGSVGPILGWQDCKYIFPMTYPDTAIVGVRTFEIKSDRFILECSVVSEQHHKIAAIMQQSIIAYDYSSLMKAPLPAAWLSAIDQIEEK
jgi:acyl-CoA thioester hydrolase